MENLSKNTEALWYSGICDALYQRIAIWHEAYWLGIPYSTRKYLSETGQIKDKIMKTAHEVPFRLIELDHLVRIVEALRPDSLLLEEIIKIRNIWAYGKPIKGNSFNKSYWNKLQLPTGGIYRSILLVFYQEHIKEILTILDEAKGIKVVPEVASGKELFEE